MAFESGVSARTNYSDRFATAPTAPSGSSFTVQLSRLLDVPQGERYVLRVVEEGGQQVAPNVEVKAPRGSGGRSTVNFGPEGNVQVRSRCEAIILRLERARSGELIGQCRIHRGDERSARNNSYSFDLNGRPVNCGIELRLLEDASQDYPSSRRVSQQTVYASRQPDGFSSHMSRGSRGGENLQSDGRSPFMSRGDDYNRMPRDSQRMLLPDQRSPQMSQGRAPDDVKVQVVGLLDVPCKYLGRRALGYVVRVLDESMELAATREIPSNAQGQNAVSLPVGAELHVRTPAPVIFMRVEHADGTTIGSCHIDRRDARCPNVSPYALSDSRGQSVHCGIELAVAEDSPLTGQPPVPGPSRPNDQQLRRGDLAGERAGPAGSLHIRVLRAYNLKQDSSLFGKQSDQHVSLRIGGLERKTPPVAGSANPVWHPNCEFSMPVGMDDGMLTVEVANSNSFGTASLGKATIGLWLLEPGRWTRLRERLADGARGEIELDVRFDPAPPAPAGMPPGVAALGNVPGAPEHSHLASLAGPYGGCGISPAPGAPWISHVPPPYAAPGRTPQRPVERLTPLPLSDDLPLEPVVPVFEIDDDWATEAPPRELEPLAPPPPESFLDPAAELWAHEPAPSSLDDLFGLDLDDEVLEETAEPWRAPVPANHEPVFQDQVFPDMDVRILLRKEGHDGSEPGRRKDKGKAAERQKEQLPEFSLGGWVEEQPLRPQAKQQAPGQGPSQLAVGGRQAASAGKGATSAEEQVQRRRWKLRVERELVQPEMIELVWQHCRNDSMLPVPDETLQPLQFDIQVIGCLGADEEPGMEKQVWVRTPSGLRHPSDDDGSADWLKAFESDVLSVGVTCRRGSRGEKDPLPNQDTFSMTRHNDISLFVVCDGHGPFGHFAAFRAAQSLPKHVLDGLSGESRPEHVLVKACEAAGQDMVEYATAVGLDLSMSGTTCAMVLQVGTDVQVAWLGDSHALVGTLPPDVATRRLDFASPAHNCEDQAEARRVRARGAEVRSVPQGPGGRTRLFAPGGRTPCLLATRALGDTGAQRLGIAVQPDVKKMSFARTPGVVLLTSGGLWDVFDQGSGSATATGQAILDLLAGECAIGKKGPETAARRLGGRTRDRWEDAAEGKSDDTTGLVLQWKIAPSSAQQATAPASTVTPAGSPSNAPATPSGAQTASQPTTMSRVPCLRPVVLPQQPVPDLVSMASLAVADESLSPTSFVAQVFSCMDVGDAVEARAWFRAPGQPSEAIDLEAALAGFAETQARSQKDTGASPVGLAVCNRHGNVGASGGPAKPSADAFSLTLAAGGRAVYVVCSGHGAMGALAAFRIAQSLPKHLLDGLERAGGTDEKDAAILAFDASATDLVRFGEAHGLDFSASGATAAAALRQGDKVLVCWLGDSRPLVATVVDADRCRVDLMAKPHTPAQEPELQRLLKHGLAVRPAKGDDALPRVFRGGQDAGSEGPGLSVSRTFGDLAVAGRGVTTSPDLARTSFESMPGLVLLGTGGLCETFEDGDAALDGLLRCGLLHNGPKQALEQLCTDAQTYWQAEGRSTEEVTGLLLHWPPEPGAALPGSAQGATQSGKTLALSAERGTRYQPRVVPIERQQAGTAAAPAAMLKPSPAPVATVGTHQARVVPIQRDAGNLGVESVQASSRQFLQARPRQQIQLAAASSDQPQQRYLQAQPKVAAAPPQATGNLGSRRVVSSLPTVQE